MKKEGIIFLRTSWLKEFIWFIQFELCAEMIETKKKYRDYNKM